MKTEASHFNYVKNKNVLGKYSKQKQELKWATASKRVQMRGQV